MQIQHIQTKTVNPLKNTIQLMLILVLMPVYIAGISAFAATQTQTSSTHIKDNNKVLVIISSDKHGYWLPEVLEPVQVLEQAGFDVDIASPKGGDGTARGGFQLSNKQENWLAQSSLKAKLDNSLSLAQVNSDDYIAVYYAGGAGPMFDLVDNHVAQNITRDIYEAGGVVSADCHGPVALINVRLSNGKRLIEGKNVTAKANVEEGRWARSNYPFLLEDKMSALGGHYSAKGKGQVHVVVDDRIVTGQNPASAKPMAVALVNQLSMFAAATNKVESLN